MPAFHTSFVLPISHLPWQEFRSLENVRRPSENEIEPIIDRKQVQRSSSFSWGELLTHNGPNEGRPMRLARCASAVVATPQPLRARISTPAYQAFKTALAFTVEVDTVDCFVVHGKGANVDVVETYRYAMVEEGARVDYSVRYKAMGCIAPRIITWLRLYVHARAQARAIRELCKERTRNRSSIVIRY